MSSFKEYFIGRMNTDDHSITIRADHLSSITFDDICAIIYHYGNNVFLSGDARAMLNQDWFDSAGEIVMDMAHNKEELAVLRYLACEYVPVNVVCIVTKQTGKIYEMSGEFAKYVKQWGLTEHNVAMAIMILFEIPSKYNPELTEAHFNTYTEPKPGFTRFSNI